MKFKNINNYIVTSRTMTVESLTSEISSLSEERAAMEADGMPADELKKYDIVIKVYEEAKKAKLLQN